MSGASLRFMVPAGDSTWAGTDKSRVWIVSPRLLVAQTVTTALTSVGADVELHAWDTVVLEALADARTGSIRYVVVVHDESDVSDLADQVVRLVRTGRVRVAVVAADAADPAATHLGVLLDEPAVDVITKAQSLGALAEAVESFASGHRLLLPEQRTALRADWKRALDNRRHVVAVVQTLSPQQRRVLELLASGHRVKEVARAMGVADGTVRSHVRALRAKLGARTQIEAVAMLRQVDEPAPGVPRPRTAPADEGDPLRRR